MALTRRSIRIRAGRLEEPADFGVEAKGGQI